MRISDWSSDVCSSDLGKALSWGVDGSIDYQRFFSSDFWMNGRMKFTYATNEYLDLDEKDSPDEYLKRVGHNINQHWGRVADRLFVDEDEIDNSPAQNIAKSLDGEIKSKYINGKGITK